jgi:hypothetical protein
MKKLLFALLSVGLLAGSAHAITLAPGTMETRLAGQLDPTTANGTLVDVNASWGYFFADNAQAGGRVTFYDNDNMTIYSAGAFAEYNFEIDSEDWLPFVEGSLALSHGDFDGGDTETVLIVEAQAGMKYFIAPNVAVSGAAVFDYATKEFFADDDKLEDTDIKVQFAIRYYY